MRDIVIHDFNISNEIQELYWIVGTEFNDESACFIRPVLRGVESGSFHMCRQPIGLMPILTLGQYYQEGRLLHLPHRGNPETCVISDLANYEEITTADIPTSLYTFHSQTTGIQRLFKYRVNDLEISIPTVELIRYLFAHNRTMANAMMRDSGLMTLYRPINPGFYDELQIDFADEMPLRAISNRFAEEFSWIAVDPDARKSWDSVYSNSCGNDYLSFIPPSIKNSRCEFRAVREGNQLLVLEIYLMSGKVQPCKSLTLTHPSLKQTVKLGNSAFTPGKQVDIDIDPDENNQPQKYEIEQKLDINGYGTTASNNPQILSNGLKRVSFENKIKIKRQPYLEPREQPPKEPSKKAERPNPKVVKKIVHVSAGDVSSYAELPPIEFMLLTPETEANSGDLACVADVIHNMAALVPDRNFSLSYSRLKSGKSFSTHGRDPRLAAIAIVESPVEPPICILDVDHSGGYALSLLAVSFREQLPMIEMETSIKQVLDGLVDNNGHWSHEIEVELENKCSFDRFPKLISPRDDQSFSSKSMLRAYKLALKLKLFEP